MKATITNRKRNEERDPEGKKIVLSKHNKNLQQITRVTDPTKKTQITKQITDTIEKTTKQQIKTQQAVTCFTNIKDCVHSNLLHVARSCNYSKKNYVRKKKIKMITFLLHATRIFSLPGFGTLRTVLPDVHYCNTSTIHVYTHQHTATQVLPGTVHCILA